MIPDAANRSIFIVGMMGAGKSTVGRHLAELTGYDFVDADKVIEERAGADISWIFDVEGEEGFRNREEQVLDDLTQSRDIVLATGGGAVLRGDNRRRLRERGVVVYLSSPVDVIVARTRHDRRRPLLQGVDAAETLAKLNRERHALYQEAAHVEVATARSSPRTVAERVMEAVENLGRPSGGGQP